MKGEKFFEAFGKIDEKYTKSAESHFYISEKREKAQKIGKIIYYIAGVAAIIAIVLAIWIPSVIFRDKLLTPASTETGTAYKTEPPTEEATDAAATSDPATEAATAELTDPSETEIPATENPVTEPPATETPTTEPPVTEVPTTEAPVTEPQVTEVPTTEAPVAEPPATLVSSITINAPQTSVEAGATVKLTATVKPDDADNKEILWGIVSGSSYGKISSDGTFTAKSAGVCTVRAKAADGSDVKADIKITVTEPAPVETFEEAVLLPVDAPQRTLTADEKERLYRIYINIMRDYKRVAPGERFQIWVSCAEPDIKLSVNDVKFEIVSGSQFAELTDKGVFTAKADGEVKIRASLKSDPSLKAERTVTITVPEKVGTWQGSGTFRDPYLISSVEDFEKMRTVSQSGSNVSYWFRQTKDLDFSGVSWTPFQMFTHKYDGGGHKIKNVTVDPGVSAYPSLFGYVKLAVIKDLTIEHFTLRNSVYRCYDAGVLFGAGIGSSIFNCTVRDAVVELTGSEGSVAGGFAGSSVEPCVFAHCSTDASCKAVFEAGGFIGNVELDEMATIFYDCRATGTAESTGDPNRCGGFFGNKQGMFEWFIKTHYIIDCACSQKDNVIEAAANGTQP